MALSNQGTGGRFSWYPKPYTKYSACEVTASGTDWSVSDNTTLFDRMETANDVLIRPADDINVKFNSSENDSVSVASGDFMNTSNLLVTDILVTCSGETVVKFFVMGWR